MGQKQEGRKHSVDTTLPHPDVQKGREIFCVYRIVSVSRPANEQGKGHLVLYLGIDHDNPYKPSAFFDLEPVSQEAPRFFTDHTVRSWQDMGRGTEEQIGEAAKEMERIYSSPKPLF